MLFQREVAQQLGVTPWTIMNWEKGRTEPPIVAISTIVRFLGYDPFPQPKQLTSIQVLGGIRNVDRRSFIVNTVYL
jgi:DNA-binding XRE family transcriptional regulator